MRPINGCMILRPAVDEVGKQADALKERIVSHGSPADALFLWDRLEDLCLLWGTESFASGSNWACGSWRARRADGLLIS